MEGRLPARPDAAPELIGPTRAAVVAALTRMIVAELEREHLQRTEPVRPEADDSDFSTTRVAATVGA